MHGKTKCKHLGMMLMTGMKEPLDYLQLVGSVDQYKDVRRTRCKWDLLSSHDTDRGLINLRGLSGMHGKTKCKHLGMMLMTGMKEPLEDPTGPGRKTSIKIDVEIRRTDYPGFLKNY
jgi:hypothetical protein